MTDSYDGFAFKVTTPDVNSPGGKRRRQLLVVAENVHDARVIAGHMIPAALLEDSGPHILTLARSIGVGDNDAKLYDPTP